MCWTLERMLEHSVSNFAYYFQTSELLIHKNQELVPLFQWMQSLLPRPASMFNFFFYTWLTFILVVSIRITQLNLVQCTDLGTVNLPMSSGPPGEGGFATESECWVPGIMRLQRVNRQESPHHLLVPSQLKGRALAVWEEEQFFCHCYASQQNFIS